MARSQPIYLADAGAKKLNVYSLPYLFRDQAHAWKVLESKVGQTDEKYKIRLPNGLFNRLRSMAN
jgi:hypothetical protein